MGDLDGLNALLKGVPEPAVTPELRRLIVDAALLAGDAATACKQEPALRTFFPDDPFPAKLQVFCQFNAGKGREAGLGIDLLREQKISDPAFFAAADALNGIRPGKLDSLPMANPLTLAMARAAKLAIPESAVGATQPPAILRTIALMPSASLEARLAAAERAEAVGALDTEALRQLYASLTFTPQELAAPLNPTATPRSRALLFRAAEQQALPAAKAEVIAKALSLAGDGTGYFAAARLFAPQIAAIKPAPELAAFAFAAARALFAAQRTDAAMAWVGLARSQGLASEAAAGTAAALWPLAHLAAAETDRPTSANVLAAWRKVRSDLPAPAAQRRAAVLYGLLAALGDKVPNEDWLALYDAPGVVSALVPRPALWHGLRLAAEDLRLGETVMLGLASIGEPGLTQVDPTDIYQVVSALRLLGLDADARALAVEAAIANGV